MNALGKVFVFATFTMSLLFLALAIGVYSNHLQWGKDTQTKQEQLSLVEKLQEKINQLSYSRDRATARYSQSYQGIVQIEATRKERKEFFDAKYDLLKTGKDKGQVVQNPVQQLEFNKQGMVELKMLGSPESVIQVRGAALLPADEAQNKLASLTKQMGEEEKQITALQEQGKELTNVMQGGPNAPGLIRDQEIQVEARKSAIGEQENLKPTLANRYSEAVLLLKREAALRKRLEQVEKSGTPVSVDR
jgi:hypothetical protein